MSAHHVTTPRQYANTLTDVNGNTAGWKINTKVIMKSVIEERLSVLRCLMLLLLHGDVISAMVWSQVERDAIIMKSTRYVNTVVTVVRYCH